MIRHLFFSILILLFTLPAVATIIEGKNTEYAGKKLEFFRYSDPVTLQKTPVFSIEPDEGGNFRTEVPEISNITFVFCDFGVYRGMLFLSPGEKITLRLPPLREKSFAEKKNPYFQPVKFWFETTDGNQLNDRIAAYDAQMNHLTQKYFKRLYFRQSKAIYDSVLTVLDQQFSEVTQPAFLTHKKLKQKLLHADAFRLSPSRVASGMEGIEQMYWTHPAFLQLFENTFSNKLSFEVKSGKNKGLREAVSAANTAFLISWLKENYQLESPLLELVLIKMLHDGFYSGDFPEDPLLNILASGILKNSRNARIAETAENVINKLRFLQPGNPAPVICLKNTDGREKCSGQTPGKFKYLLFADTEMVVCREHLKYLKTIEEKFHESLEIIIILRKTDLIEMKMFLNRQEIPGIHLIDEDNRFIEKYRVQSFPVCFLLNERHEFVFQHTRAPLDGFEQQFGAYLKKELFRRQRNQAR